MPAPAMRVLPIVFLLALASGASAQTDARLHGAWAAIPDSSAFDLAQTEVLSMWMEFDARGQLFAQARLRYNGDLQESAAAFEYTVDGDQIETSSGSPARFVFHDDDRVRISELDGTQAVEFVRVEARVGGLDELGDWTIANGPAEAVTFSADEPARVLFYLDDRLVDSGTWRVDASGLTIKTPGMGTVLYTAVARDGEYRTLTSASGETLMLAHLAEGSR
ncbi:MAG: hypothetical protein AAFQ43_15520 [Bacteroidota bacterium]